MRYITEPILCYLVDAFSQGAAGGSPTGVVPHAHQLSAGQMSWIAQQLGVSHTAFLLEPRLAGAEVGVRFFTLTGEIGNCGHGTIAAHYIRAKALGENSLRHFYQETKSGLQRVTLMVAGSTVDVLLHLNEVQFEQPSKALIDAVVSACALRMADIAEDLPVVLASPGTNRFLLGLRSAEQLAAMQPDFAALGRLCRETHSLGCFAYVLDRDAPQRQATGRMFAPAIGVNEDVINGNSSGCLGAYLLHIWQADQLDLRVKQGQHFQREGVVRVKAQKTGPHVDTAIGGQARLITERRLAVPLAEELTAHSFNS